MSDDRENPLSNVAPTETKEQGRANLARHQSQCTVCQSEYRANIEEEYLDWHSPDTIAYRYKTVSKYAIYRHVHAVDLISKRRKNLRMALERLVERGDTVQLSGSAVISAIKLLIQLDGAAQDEQKAPKSEVREAQQHEETNSKVTETKPDEETNSEVRHPNPVE